MKSFLLFPPPSLFSLFLPFFLLCQCGSWILVLFNGPSSITIIIHFDAEVSTVWQRVFCPWNPSSHHFLKLFFLLSGTARCFRLILYFLCPRLEVSHSKELWFFYWEMVLRNKIRAQINMKVRNHERTRDEELHNLWVRKNFKYTIKAKTHRFNYVNLGPSPGSLHKQILKGQILKSHSLDFFSSLSILLPC